jgi:hypothetical protein
VYNAKLRAYCGLALRERKESMKKLDEYFKLQKEIYEYFGYKEDWVVIPIDDGRNYYWHLEGEGSGDSVLFAEDKNNLFDGTDKDGYSNEIYTQRFLPKWVYRGKEYTMVCVDTHTDGNKFLQIFDNKKEIKTAPKEEC